MEIVAIASDHAGFEYKEQLRSHLLKEGWKLTDFGTFSPDSVDYPDFVHPLAKAVSAGDCAWGILICGSANGVAITANKYENIRAGIAWEPELAVLTKQHNNANVICLPARFISFETASEIVLQFAKTQFEGGRHQRRVDKITSC